MDPWGPGVGAVDGGALVVGGGDVAPLPDAVRAGGHRAVRGRGGGQRRGSSARGSVTRQPRRSEDVQAFSRARPRTATRTTVATTRHVVAVPGMALLKACTSSSSAGAASPTPSLSSPAAVTTPTPTGSVSLQPGAVGERRDVTGADDQRLTVHRARPVPSGSIAEDGLPMVTISRPQRGDAVRLPCSSPALPSPSRRCCATRSSTPRGASSPTALPTRTRGSATGALAGRGRAAPGSLHRGRLVASPKDGSRIAEARVKFHAG